MMLLTVIHERITTNQLVLYYNYLLYYSFQRFDLTDRIETCVYEHKQQQQGAFRLAIRSAELRAVDNGKLWQQLRMDPLRHLRALETACRQVASELRPGSEKEGASLCAVD